MSDSRPNMSVFFHWFAWTMSVTASVFFLIFLVGEGFSDIVRGKAKELIPYLPFLLLSISGCALSFFKRKAGAILMIVGGVAIDVILYFQGGQANFRVMVLYGLPYIFPGILLLLFRK
jgi:hypothetical protein